MKKYRIHPSARLPLQQCTQSSSNDFGGAFLMAVSLIFILGSSMPAAAQFGSNHQRGSGVSPHSDQWAVDDEAHAPAEGKIVAIDRKANVITLFVPAIGKTNSYGVTSYTKFAVNGHEASISEISVGQAVKFTLMSNKKDLSVVRVGKTKGSKSGQGKKNTKK